MCRMHASQLKICIYGLSFWSIQDSIFIVSDPYDLRLLTTRIIIYFFDVVKADGLFILSFFPAAIVGFCQL